MEKKYTFVLDCDGVFTGTSKHLSLVEDTSEKFCELICKRSISAK